MTTKATAQMGGLTLDIEALRTRSRTENGQAVYMTQQELNALCDLALQSLESVRSEALLAQFGNWVMEELRVENIGNDLDGGAAQDKAEELGLLVRVHVTEPCGERCECAEYGDFPQMCLRRALSPARVAEELDPGDRTGAFRND